MAEAILPESDDDAVRIMTIHGAKGLEFPITIVSGMSTAPSGRPGPGRGRVPRRAAAVGYKFGKNVTTQEYVEWAPIDEQMGLHERIRLLYVACTRARDHLVVSLHRKERANGPGAHGAHERRAASRRHGRRCSTTLPDGARARDVLAPVVLEPPTPPPPSSEWAAERTAALLRGVSPDGGGRHGPDRRGRARQRGRARPRARRSDPAISICPRG